MHYTTHYLTRLLSRFCLALTLLGAAACGGSKPQATATQPARPSQAARTSVIAFYNLENLYDLEDDPKIDDQEFVPTSPREWTDLRYRTKLRNLASVIAEIGSPTGPDILGVNEVENKRVLQDLVAEPLIADRHYEIVHFDSPDPRGIDVALLYKPEHFTLTGQRAVPIALPDTTMGTRDVLQVEGRLNGDPITFLVCHWSSRIRGQKSINRRLAIARQCRQLIDARLSTSPQARVLLMGDLNDTPTDSSLTGILRASGDAQHLTDGQLYNAFYDLQVQGKGTMYFRSRPDVFDQMVLSPGLVNGTGMHYKLGSATIYAPERLTSPQAKWPGEPLRTYAGRKYIGGYSDHFPVYLTLTK